MLENRQDMEQESQKAWQQLKITGKPIIRVLTGLKSTYIQGFLEKPF